MDKRGIPGKTSGRHLRKVSYWGSRNTYYLNDVVSFNGKNHSRNSDNKVVNPTTVKNGEWTVTKQDGTGLSSQPGLSPTLLEDMIFDKREIRACTTIFQALNFLRSMM